MTARTPVPSRALRFVPHLLVAAIGYTLFVVAGLPDLLTGRFEISLAAFGLLTSLPLGAFVVAQPLAGRFGDRYPTTRILLVAAALHAGLAVALDLPLTAGPTGGVGGFEALLALRFCWGLVAGLMLSVGATHIARLSGGSTGTLSQGIYGGMLTLGGAAGFLLGSPVAAWTDGAGLHALGALPAIPAVAVCWVNRRERHTDPTTANIDDTADDGGATGTWATVFHPTVLLAATLYVALIGSYITLSTFVTTYFEDAGVLVSLNAVVLVFASVGRVAGGVAVWRLPIGDADLAGGAALGAAVGFGALALVQNGPLVVVLPLAAMLVVSVPFGAVFNVAASENVDEGTALATVIAAGNVAALVLPPVSGALRESFGSFGPPFAVLAALNLLALASALALSRRVTRGTDTQPS